jgi:hypothetical protein
MFEPGEYSAGDQVKWTLYPGPKTVYTVLRVDGDRVYLHGWGTEAAEASISYPAINFTRVIDHSHMDWL